jgi:hypothetical protein
MMLIPESINVLIITAIVVSSNLVINFIVRFDLCLIKSSVLTIVSTFNFKPIIYEYTNLLQKAWFLKEEYFGKNEYDPP